MKSIFEDDLAGFKTYRNHEHMEDYINDTGLLEGALGIGLYLIHFFRYSTKKKLG